MRFARVELVLLLKTSLIFMIVKCQRSQRNDVIDKIGLGERRSSTSFSKTKGFR